MKMMYTKYQWNQKTESMLNHVPKFPPLDLKERRQIVRAKMTNLKSSYVLNQTLVCIKYATTKEAKTLMWKMTAFWPSLVIKCNCWSDFFLVFGAMFAAQKKQQKIDVRCTKHSGSHVKHPMLNFNNFRNYYAIWLRWKPKENFKAFYLL